MEKSLMRKSAAMIMPNTSRAMATPGLPKMDWTYGRVTGISVPMKLIRARAMEPRTRVSSTVRNLSLSLMVPLE